MDEEEARRPPMDSIPTVTVDEGADSTADGNDDDLTDDGCSKSLTADPSVGEPQLLALVAREREAMETEFDTKRARFVELFRQKEIELSEATEKRDELFHQVRQLQDELDEAKSQVAIAECTAENLVDEEKRKCRDEIASLQRIIKEAMAEAALVKSRHDAELSRLKGRNEKLEADVHDLMSSSSISADSGGGGKEGVLSAVTKTLAKRVPGLNAYSQSVDSAVHENLEEGMKKAQEDAEVLRSLVVPLEEEIKVLKEKLRAADDELRFRSAVCSNSPTRSASVQVSSDVASVEPQQLQRTTLVDGEIDMDEKLKGLHKGLQAEKSSRSDLEMYVSVLQKQKAMLQAEADGLRKELGEVCQLLDKEKREHRELKQTWQMANDKFLECQKVQSDDLRRIQICIQSVLTAEQQKTVAELQKKETAVEVTVDSRSSSKRSSPISFSSSPRLRKSPSPAPHSAMPIISGDDDDDNDGGGNKCSVETESSLEGDRKAISMQAVVMESASSTDSIDEQPYNLHAVGHDGEMEGRDKSDDVEDVDRRPVLGSGDKSEIELLHEELRSLRERTCKPCDMCSNYETQLQRAQERNVELQRKAKSLEKSKEWHLADLHDEQRAKRELEEKLLQLSVEMQDQLAELYKRTEETERMHAEARRACAEYVHWTKGRLHELAAGREELQGNLDRLQCENDKLVGKYSAHSQQMQSEAINLPDAVEDMQLLLLRLQEDLIVAKVAKEHLEETLRSEILFLRERVIGEQQSRESNEHVLTQECDTLRQEVAILESIREQLNGEQIRRAEADRSLRELQQRLVENQAKHKQIASALTKRVEEGVKIKERLEAEVAQLRLKVQTLQTDLDNSEAVQRDFVKLSQSLQVQLEKIRESEKEVRWQHEEDADECSNCRQPFSVTRRRHHCRHCGHIFCADCTSKVVLSGPMRRPSKVCDVCHTLLVPDTAPYFSTEAPHTPD